MIMSQIHLWHVLMIGPTLYYIGNNNKTANQCSFIVLATLALSILFVIRRPKLTGNKVLVRMVHYIVFVPLFLYISYKNVNLPMWSFEIIKYLGIIAIAIHLHGFITK